MPVGTPLTLEANTMGSITVIIYSLRTLSLSSYINQSVCNLINWMKEFILADASPSLTLISRCG